MTYLVLKALHILSMVFLFGTGLGSAFYSRPVGRVCRSARLRLGDLRCPSTKTNRRTFWSLFLNLPWAAGATIV